MKTPILLDSLNDAQRKAVSAPLSHQLILAGAGSGKTRVLVHRIAWLIEQEGLSPFSILAVTFTNKAAHEMRLRIETMLGVSAKAMWVGTFHGIAHRLLRLHWREANLPQAFQILDSDDQLRIIRRAMAVLQLDEERWPPKQAQWYINGKKDEGLEAHQVPDYGDIAAKTMIKIYHAYTEACQRAGLIDFADLLLKVQRLWLNNPEVLAHYQQRFRCVLIDEFQDTNTIQYAWVRMLAGGNNSIMVVGDDDQSIYGWRGAKIENIHRFNKDFPHAITTRLEQNYRSTGVILKAANALIDHNTGRLGKNLWTAGAEGAPITVYAGFNDLDEARYVASGIREWQASGEPLREVGVLYRSNAQSRVIEEALMQCGIPYQVYGGLRFFDRAEIRDVLAYLRLISNRDDDAAFERVVNTPTRGIGERTLAIVRSQAQQQQISLWKAAYSALAASEFTARAANALQQFLTLIDTLTTDSEALPLYEQIEYIMHQSGLVAQYRQEKGERGLTRLENLGELVSAARQFDVGDLADEMSPLSAFIAYSTLESGNSEQDSAGDSVQLMTLHSAKGLEFPVVFVCGCEEELFPHRMSLNSPGGLEEERRLCYVGMTRAMKKLYMTYAEVRRLYGRETYPRPSRFLKEIPAVFLEEVRQRTTVAYPAASANSRTQRTFSSSQAKQWQAASDGQMQVGQYVSHEQFGEGVVLQYEGHGEHARIQVRFEKMGTKWLIASFVAAK